MMFNSLLQLDITLLPFNPETLCRILLYGDPNFSAAQNHDILTITKCAQQNILAYSFTLKIKFLLSWFEYLFILYKIKKFIIFLGFYFSLFVLKLPFIRPSFRLSEFAS